MNKNLTFKTWALKHDCRINPTLKALFDKGINPISRYLMAFKNKDFLGQYAVLKNYKASCNSYLNGKKGYIVELHEDLFLMFDEEGTINQLKHGVYLDKLKHFDLIKEGVKQ